MKYLKKHKGKIISVLIIIIVFAIMYFSDRNVSKESEKSFSNEAFPSVTISEEIVTVNEDVSEKVNDTTKENQNTKVLPAEKPESDSDEIEEKIDEKLICTLSVRCDTINQNIGLLDESKRVLIPSDGIIFNSNKVEFSEGDSVFDVLLREMKNNGIHFEYVSMPVYDSAYIEGINNIYEFDCGSRSGWLYRVNGEFPKYGCSQYKLKNGDIVELVFSCDMGKDVGKI